MKVLLTGATGYIGKRLLPVLLAQGHEVVCCVRDINRFDQHGYPAGLLSVVEVDFLLKEEAGRIPTDIDVAFFLIHSMSSAGDRFDEMEAQAARNFRDRMEKTRVRQVIYLSGIVNETVLSRHLSSRKKVEEILSSGRFALTTLRAGIIVGSGSASFEIIRDLVEKLPFMIAPRWLSTRCQPIGIRNVLQFLSGVMLHPETFNRSFDIGGSDILTYREMLLRFARIRGLKRSIFILPVMTPRLSGYWLFFVTTVSYSLAKHLVNSMKVEVICSNNELETMLNITPCGYDDAIRQAFEKIEHHEVTSRWSDALANTELAKGFSRFMVVPEHGCYQDIRKCCANDPDRSLGRVLSIGGDTGWYFATRLWQFRGFLDRMAGGVGLRRGRKSPDEIAAGDTLDFWRVLIADREEKRLLLYGEMKMPGEAWLEFRFDSNHCLIQTATFRPTGIWGRLYWIILIPLHHIIFAGMIRKICR